MPVGLWLALQLGALGLSAYRVPLAAQYPQPAEFQAVSVMLAAQFTGLALLFPSLLADAREAIVIASAGWVMLLASAALAGWPLSGIAPAGGFLSLWIVALATIRAAIPARWHMTASAAACVYIIGGPIVAYFRREFAGSSPVYRDVVFGPLFSAISTPHHLTPLAWAQATGLGILAFLALFAGHRMRNRAPFPSTHPV
jgi:hypothetical protein